MREIHIILLQSCQQRQKLLVLDFNASHCFSRARILLLLPRFFLCSEEDLESELLLLLDDFEVIS